MQFPRETEEFAKAALLLHTIKDDTDRLDLVLELQRMLIRNIVKCERRIRRLKRARGRLQSLKARRLSKDRSKGVKTLIERIDARVEQMRHLMFLWRCFGDGIASVYQSTHSLKHLFYGENYQVKQEAGFISDKAGFHQEFRFLRRGIRMNVPIVMSDLTNVIRHGDLCGLAGLDPVPIEVKSSRNRNARTGRQVKQLKEIAEFFANDGAPTFRGGINVKRVEQRLPQVTYVREANDCLSRAATDGLSICSPERGLTYVAVSDEGFQERRALFEHTISEHTNSSTLVTHLIPDASWLPAFPFTLSMHPANAVMFMQQRVHLLVLVDLEVVKSNFLDRGVHSIALMDGTYSIQICLDPDDLMKGAWRISELMFFRVMTEFQSLRWFADENSTVFEAHDVIEGPVTLDSPELVFEVPADWANAVDFYKASRRSRWKTSEFTSE